MGAIQLPPNIFAMVMSTGIVSLAAKEAGLATVGNCLFYATLVIYFGLWFFFLARVKSQPLAVLEDLQSHPKAPGFFTMVASTAILGLQFIFIQDSQSAGLFFWIATLTLWTLFTYTIFPLLMGKEEKPPLEKSLNGGWLVVVVATQAVSVLGSLIGKSLPEGWGPFLPLCFWLLGGMLYIWLISLIFYRILFLPLGANDLTPAYWINMGAMAISSLAGMRVASLAPDFPLITQLLPFIHGFTLLFWATATWWIPVLLVLGFWRHWKKKFPLAYDHGYWSAVFPIGMYSVATRAVANGIGLPFLLPLAEVFVWLALAALLAIYATLASRLLRPENQ